MLFAVSQNTLRVGIAIHDEIADILYESNTVSKPFLYTIKKWFIAIATVSYSTGFVNCYLWLPMNN